MIKLTAKNGLIAAAVIAVSVAGVAAVNNPTPVTATDTTPTEQQVDKNTQELSNHESRITNSENDIKALQDNTGTSPSSNDTSVSAPAVAPVTSPVAITVASYEKIDLGNQNIDCKYTYTDGTTYQWHWQTWNPQASWETDSMGQNGHWVGGIETHNECSDIALGAPKLN